MTFFLVIVTCACVQCPACYSRIVCADTKSSLYPINKTLTTKMSCPISKDSLDQLKAFVDLCISKPDIFSFQELEFFKSYIESLGGKIPTPKKQKPEEKTEKTEKEIPMEQDPAKDEVPSDPEPDLEFDMEGCLEPDEIDENLQIMGDATKEVTEEETNEADEKRVEAMSQLGEGNTEKAIKLFSEAIKINPQSALLFAKRGQAYLRFPKPNACIKDCTRALELNCDSAAAYKFRGRAYRLLGEWEKAAQDLRQAVKIDFDEQANEWLREVQPNAHKIEQHRLKQERKKLAKEEYDRLQRIKMAKEAQKFMTSPDLPTGMADVYKLLQDPEILTAFQDPEIAAAFQDITSNPANFAKYQANPKIKSTLEKLATKVKAEGMSFPFQPKAPGSADVPAGTSEPPKSTTEKPPEPTTDKAPKSTTDDDALD